MPQPLKASLPPDCILSAGYVIRITALNPVDGSTVAGVSLSDISFFVTPLDQPLTGENGEAPMPLLVPSDQLE